MSGLNASNKHHFQVTQIKNEATNDTTMTISVLPLPKVTIYIIMDNVWNVTNSNSNHEMSNDLKLLENKKINLFNITHNYAINGGSLNSFEKLIPILLECGTIIIDTHSSQMDLLARRCDKVINFILKIFKTSSTAAFADLLEFLDRYQNNLGKAAICCIESIDLIDDELNKLNVFGKQYLFDDCGTFLVNN